jgi:chromosome partitioning protein
MEILAGFWHAAQRAAKKHGSQIILLDLAPSLGSINRAALIAADFVVIPLGPGFYSLLGLQHAGPTLRSWRFQWHDRCRRWPHDRKIDLPRGDMQPIGYVVLRQAIRLDRPANTFNNWMDQYPSAYYESVLDRPAPHGLSLNDDTNCIARLRDYRSLLPLAQEA